jgi:hypothetical protein
LNTARTNPINTFYSDQICYTNDINRAGAVCFGITNAIELFKKSYLYNFYLKVIEETEIEKQALAANTPLQAFPFSGYKMLLMKEQIFDNFLIGTSFELLGKAFLLDAGYLVHTIRPSKRSVPTSIFQLSQHQKNSPIKISDYLQADQFSEQNNEGKNSLKYLELKTVEYHTIYEQPGYISVLPFSADFIALAAKYRGLRNMIHFPVRGASEVEIKLGPRSLVEAYEVMRNEWSRVINRKFETLKQQHRLLLDIPTF